MPRCFRCSLFIKSLNNLMSLISWNRDKGTIYQICNCTPTKLCWLALVQRTLREMYCNRTSWQIMFIIIKVLMFFFFLIAKQFRSSTTIASGPRSKTNLYDFSGVVTFDLLFLSGGILEPSTWPFSPSNSYFMSQSVKVWLWLLPLVTYIDK